MLISKDYKVMKLLNNFLKKGLLKKRRDLIIKMILDTEIDLEVEWLLMNRAQKELEETIKEITKNLQIIKEEKEKTPMDMERVKELSKENVRLGLTDLKGKNNEPIYAGKAGGIKEIITYHYKKVNEKVGEREYHKLRLKAVNRMLETGYMDHFDEIIKSDEEIEFRK